ncbi:MAG: hypothetical protein ABI488_02400 [Polyangiaceae bacterium]
MSDSVSSIDSALGECGVRQTWFVDPDAQTLEVFALDGESYRLLDVLSGDQIVRGMPFDAIELSAL